MPHFNVDLLNFYANVIMILLLCVWFVVESRRQKWRVLDFLRHQTIEHLERKIFSFDDAVLPKIITDQKGLVLDINTEAQKLFRYEEKEIINKNISIIFPPDNKGKYEQMMRDSENVKKNEEKKPSRYDLVKSGGERFPSETIIRRRIIGGRFIYIFVIRDRTADEITANKLMQYNDILKLKIDILSRGEQIANTGSWIWDLKTQEMEKAITPSENYRRIVGLKGGPGSYSIENIKPRVWPKDAKIVDAALDKAIKGGEDYDIKFRMIRGTDFQVIHIRSQVKVFRDADGVVIALAGVATLLKTENLSEASRAEELHDSK